MKNLETCIYQRKTGDFFRKGKRTGSQKGKRTGSLKDKRTGSLKERGKVRERQKN